MSVHLKINPQVISEVDYPEGDGKPMAESDLHREIMFYIIHLLQRFFAGKQVYISGNLLVYYEEGNPRKSVAPDCFVVRNIDPHRRPIYKIWEEGKDPEVVFEVSSKTTKRVDLNEKMRLYAQLGVQEYFIYDPTRDYLDPPLAGFALTGSGYVAMQPITGLQYVSNILGLRLALDENNRLQFFEVGTHARLLTDNEVRQQAETAQLQAETAQFQAETAQIQAETARQQAEQLASLAVARATDAENRAADMAAENARLRAELARLCGESSSA